MCVYMFKESVAEEHTLGNIQGIFLSVGWSLYVCILYYLSQSKRTALHYASGGGHHDTVRVLLERGADPNTHDKVSGVWLMNELQMYLHECL